MGLLTAGYWQSNYWVENYWTDDYWQDYGAVFYVQNLTLLNVGR